MSVSCSNPISYLKISDYLRKARVKPVIKTSNDSKFIYIQIFCIFPTETCVNRLLPRCVLIHERPCFQMQEWYQFVFSFLFLHQEIEVGVLLSKIHTVSYTGLDLNVQKHNMEEISACLHSCLAIRMVYWMGCTMCSLVWQLIADHMVSSIFCAPAFVVVSSSLTEVHGIVYIIWDLWLFFLL